MGREGERIYCEGGPLKVTVDGQHIRMTIIDTKDPASYFFLRVPAKDGLRVIHDIKACLYAIHAMEDEN